MSGTLYVVATPIGNLEDITLRALRVLREVDLIAAEDTRRTAKLLTHYGIPTATTSFHEHNAHARVPQLIRRIAAGAQVALVTDAGTPGISDPGVELVDACIRAGLAVDPIPGVSAPVTAAIGSGFPLVPLTFMGFAPHRASDRRKWLHVLSQIPHTVTFFESPHRIDAALADMSTVLGDRPIVVGRELTKTHQQFLRGTAASVSATLEVRLGEFTIVLGPVPQATETKGVLVSDDMLVREFGRSAKDAAASRREAIGRVAKKFGVPSRRVYLAVEKAKQSGN